MAVELTKPWLDLNDEAVAKLPGQLGVYELADEAGQTIYIGFAGGRSLFGLRSELEVHLGQAQKFRVEVTNAYRTRHRELLMAYHARHGVYPAANTDDETQGLGRISLQGGKDAS